MTTVILTCAGKSTRFPNHRSKWSLTHPTGHTMAAMALRGLRLPSGTKIVAAFNPHDFDLYGEAAIAREFSTSGFVVKPVSVGETTSQVQTVKNALVAGKVESGSPVVVRDCDNYFAFTVRDENAVAVVDLNDVETPLVVKNKSFAVVDEPGNYILHLAEKKVLSHLFCCGAYSFRTARDIELAHPGAEFLSQVVELAIINGTSFKARPAFDYSDWGTEQTWLDYTRQWKTLFVDIDGVLVKSSHRTFDPVWGTSDVIQENIDALNALHLTGKVEIILTTSRAESYRADTTRQLRGLQFDRLIMGLRNCARVVVNDSVGKRRQMTALAVNIERESPALGELLGTL